MTREMKMEIASLMKRFPHLYPSDKYNSSQRKFIILEEELFRSGHTVIITRTQVKSRVNAKNKLIRKYNYHVTFDMRFHDTWKIRESAVKYVFKLYKQHCNG